MSEKLLDRPIYRCDSGPNDAAGRDGGEGRGEGEGDPRGAAAAGPAGARPRSAGLPMASSGVGAALARDPVDEPWRKLLAAFADADLPLLRLVPDQAEGLVQQGVPSAIVHRLLHGYPAAPLRMGTLRFFPPLAQVLEARRLPAHFYVAEAFDGAHAFKRRLRQALADVEQSEEGGTEEAVAMDSDESLDRALLAAATRYVEAFGARPATSQDAAAQNLKHWLPGAEAALAADTGEAEHVALLGPLMSWEDYRAELERRLMVARLWSLLGLVAAVAALSRSGALSSRLLLAFGALGILGGGLGLAPWLRATSRLRELTAADPTLRDAEEAS